MEEALTSLVPCTDIAGFGSLVFSVLVGVAIAASLEAKVLQAGLGGWLKALMILGAIGASLYPASIFVGWSNLDGSAKWFAVLTGLLWVGSLITLSGYYYMYFRNRVWSAEHIEVILPSDTPLLPD